MVLLNKYAKDGGWQNRGEYFTSSKGVKNQQSREAMVD